MYTKFTSSVMVLEGLSNVNSGMSSIFLPQDQCHYLNEGAEHGFQVLNWRVDIHFPLGFFIFLYDRNLTILLLPICGLVVFVI